MTEQIFETEWLRPTNALVWIKYFYAIKNGKIFTALATKGYSFDTLSTARGSTSLINLKEEIKDDSIEAKNKVKKWLEN